ncbi:MAG: cold shock domain-containing protein [Bacilli bacterium]|nr:cold shock domain-containing protein [Bacilli bacterium]
MSNNIARGKVKWFNNEKGYGFIETENITGDIFVHYSQIVAKGYKTLQKDQMVEFELVRGDKGYQANNVIKL